MVSSQPGVSRGRSDYFAPTHWSAVIAAGSEAEPEKARRALEELCQTYWAPVYTFVRSRGYSVHDAQDLAQGFFLNFVERQIYAQADRARGRFRSFLLTALKNFLANAYEHAHRLKRGGGHEFLPLDEVRAEAAESLFQTQFTSVPIQSDDRVYERSWAETLVNTSLERLASEYRRDGKEALLEDLRVFITGSAEPLPSYDELAVKTGLPASTLRSHVTRLRSRYREFLRSAVRETVENDAEVEEEMRELFRVLSAG